ncbi:hypothetical protein LG634_08670 [Streptomyces bambusae]|uniref:hypothetical protein n=1 Tax=Streptomyces bambusae TaxID=1550616 RepID=UPI001CFCBDA3|nr:hypothetical protein [Streptomyces bambusae]MCB5164901.1 hypothetical protein [Streptomyces bambusae]
MRLTTVAAATALTTALTTAALIPAVAAAAPAGSTTPDLVGGVTSAAPGGTVGLTLRNCRNTTSTATSTAFISSATLRRLLGSSDDLQGGNATLSANVTPGSTYMVRFTCGNRSTTANFTVTPGAARGGLGGSIDTTSPAHIAIGAALVAGAAGTAVWVVRRRSHSQA